MIPVDKDEVYDLAKPCEQQVETKKFEKKDAENIVGSDFNYIRFFQQVALLKKISRKEVKKIPLVIIMNFWDKLDKTSINITPEDRLESILPWFYNFIMCNWDKEYIQVYGASPLGSLAESLRVRTLLWESLQAPSARKIVRTAGSSFGMMAIARDRPDKLPPSQSPFLRAYTMTTRIQIKAALQASFFTKVLV